MHITHVNHSRTNEKQAPVGPPVYTDIIVKFSRSSSGLSLRLKVELRRDAGAPAAEYGRQKRARGAVDLWAGTSIREVSPDDAPGAGAAGCVASSTYDV
jgi:hypothetical protein